MRVEIDLDDADFQAFIQRINAAASDMSPAMKAIAPLGEQQIEDSFQSETAPDGTAWEDSRRKKERGGKTLTKDGNLRRSASSDFDGKTAMWGVGMIYAPIQQFGGTITAKNGGKLKFPTPDGGYAQVSSVTIPARPIVPDSIEQIDLDAVIDILGAHLNP